MYFNPLEVTHDSVLENLNMFVVYFFNIPGNSEANASELLGILNKCFPVTYVRECGS